MVKKIINENAAKECETEQWKKNEQQKKKYCTIIILFECSYSIFDREGIDSLLIYDLKIHPKIY